jgi:predicted dehydrogenase
VYKKFDPDGELFVYDSLPQACQDPDVDGLIIATPNYTHIDVTREAIKSGKHILLEKPMATTLADAFEIFQFSNEYPAVFQIGLQYRYKSIITEAIHEAFVRKSLGQIHTISISEHRVPFLDKVNQWNKFSCYSGGTLVEKCCHYFDLLNLFSGSRPIRVMASGSAAVNFREFEYKGKKSDILDNAFVIVEYKNGVRASFNLCMFAPLFFEELVLCGDGGRLHTWERQDFQSSARLKTHLEVFCGEDKPIRISQPAYPFYIEDLGHHGSTFFEHRYFIDNIDGNSTSTATVEEGFWSIVVGVAAEEAVRTGRIVEIERLLEQNGIPLSP